MKTKHYVIIILLLLFALASCDNLLFRKVTGIFRATFETNGGSVVEPLETVTIDTSPTTTKDDYQFDGWYLQSAFSDKVNFPFPLTENTTFYAKWLQKFKVVFESNGGASIPTTKYAIIESEPLCTKGGFALDGWFTTPNFTDSPIVFPYNVIADTTLYAKWLPTYYVQFVTNGGSSLSPYEVTKIQFQPETLRDGYTFYGWYTDAGFTNKVNFPYTLSADTTLYAKWKQKFNVKFDTQGGSAIADIYTSDIEAVPSPTKENKDFAGWYTDIACTEESKVSFPYSVESDVTFYAKWKQQQCSITYYSNGGTGGIVPAATNVDKGAAYTISANTGNLVKNGYAFTKWNTKADGTGTNYTPGQKINSVTNDISLYAMWGLDYSAMITVKGGTFLMGGHNVTISSYQLAAYELTYELWTEVRNWALNNGYSFQQAYKGGTDKDKFTNFEPVMGVPWCSAVVWCNAYSEYKGLTPCYYRNADYSSVMKMVDDDYRSSLEVYWNTSANGYRLPTEPEWEYAAVGGETGMSGYTNIKEYAWYSENASSETHPVGKKIPNSLGFYDMLGNAAEWCFSKNYTYTVDDEVNPVIKKIYAGYGNGDYVTYRGGSFQTSSSRLGEAVRDWTQYTNSRIIELGIRVARNEE